jgi:hypothetical protein
MLAKLFRSAALAWSIMISPIAGAQESSYCPEIAQDVIDSIKKLSDNKAQEVFELLICTAVYTQETSGKNISLDTDATNFYYVVQAVSKDTLSSEWVALRSRILLYILSGKELIKKWKLDIANELLWFAQELFQSWNNDVSTALLLEQEWVYNLSQVYPALRSIFPRIFAHSISQVK